MGPSGFPDYPTLLGRTKENLSESYSLWRAVAESSDRYWPLGNILLVLKPSTPSDRKKANV